MAIRLVEGPPGSGKTYYVVHHLVKHYFEKQSDGRFELVKPCTLITNIDNFQPTHIDLNDVMDEAGGPKSFFTVPYQEEFQKQFDSQIVYIIDEVQRFFRKGDRDKDLNDVFFYFEYHRHLGHDIYLITQNIKKLPTDIITLLEYVIIAAPRSRNVIGEFKYKWESDGIILKREALKPDKNIFALYKSMDAAETEKVKNPLIRTILIVLTVCIVIGSFLSYRLWYEFIGKNKSNQNNEPQIAETPQSKIEAISKPTVSMPADGLFTDYMIVEVSHISEKKMIGSFIHETITIVFKDMMWPKEIFPFPLKKYRNSYYASIPRSMYDEMNSTPVEEATNLSSITTDQAQQ